MKAVVFDKGNSTNQLVYREIEKPIPNDDEILVKIHAVSLNAADYRSMKMGLIPKKKIFGADIAGKVEAVGKNISQFKINDEVVGDLSNYGFGGLAEYCVAPERLLVKKPADISFERAASVPMASITALQGLRNKGNIQQGQKVLICGAGGGVGTFAVQLAKYYGALVTATCGPNNVDRVLSIGADRVIDYTKVDFTEEDTQYDLIFLINGNHSLSACRKALMTDGTLVVAGGALPQVFRTMLLGPFLSLGRKKIVMLAAKSDTKDLEFILKLVTEGKLQTVIEQEYPLNQAIEAFGYLSKGHAKGKIVITVA